MYEFHFLEFYSYFLLSLFFLFQPVFKRASTYIALSYNVTSNSYLVYERSISHAKPD